MAMPQRMLIWMQSCWVGCTAWQLKCIMTSRSRRTMLVLEKSARQVQRKLFQRVSSCWYHRCALAGYQEEFQELHYHVNVSRIQSICQDIIFLSSRGHKLTPKHIGIGLTVHQATRSKQLVQLLHTAGYSVNYDTVLRMDNTIANDALERYKESGNMLVPGNFTRTTDPAGYTRSAVDNIDITKRHSVGWAHSMRRRLPPFLAKRKKNQQWISNCLLSQKGNWI